MFEEATRHVRVRRGPQPVLSPGHWSQATPRQASPSPPWRRGPNLRLRQAGDRSAPDRKYEVGSATLPPRSRASRPHRGASPGQHRTDRQPGPRQAGDWSPAVQASTLVPIGRTRSSKTCRRLPVPIAWPAAGTSDGAEWPATTPCPAVWAASSFHRRAERDGCTCARSQNVLESTTMALRRAQSPH